MCRSSDPVAVGVRRNDGSLGQAAAVVITNKAELGTYDNYRLAGNVAAVIDGGALEQPLDTPDGTGAKALPLTFRQESVALRPTVAHPAREAYAAPPTHAARAGPARAPPLA